MPDVVDFGCGRQVARRRTSLLPLLVVPLHCFVELGPRSQKCRLAPCQHLRNDLGRRIFRGAQIEAGGRQMRLEFCFVLPDEVGPGLTVSSPLCFDVSVVLFLGQHLRGHNGGVAGDPASEFYFSKPLELDKGVVLDASLVLRLLLLVVVEGLRRFLWDLFTTFPSFLLRRRARSCRGKLRAVTIVFNTF